MELELNSKSHVFYDTGARLTATREQTQEQVVPDARPDILRIVNVYGSVLTSDKSLRDGRAEVGGSVRASVLYLPEDGEGVEQITLSIPFAHAFEVVSDPDDLLFCTSELESIDARTVNPRKVLVRANVRVNARIVRRRQAELPCEATAPERLGVRTLVETRKLNVATAATAKSFSISETIELNGAAAMAEIISSRLTLKAGDYNIIGRRVVFKASATVDMLYRSTGGAICTHRCELPFSQILEPDGADEGSTIIIRLHPCDMTTAIRQEDGGRSFELTFTAEAEASAYSEREFETVADLYSTAMRASVESGELELETFGGRSERRSTVRSTIETGTQARDAEDADVTFTQGSIVRGEDGTAVECSADVRVRYTGEDGSQYTARSRVPVRIELDGDGEPSVELRAENIAVSAAAVGGVDVRFDAVADVEMTRRESIPFVKSAKLEEFGEDAPARPSVVLRYPNDGESMWQVAKRYLTTEDDIREANGLAAGEIPAPDKLMLIPKRR